MAVVQEILRADEQRKHADRLRDASLVHEMRLEGHSYLKIAKALKIAPERVKALHVEHIDHLRELEALGAAEASRRVQDDRYEALLMAVWRDAMGGDLAAVRECRQILDSITAREAKVTALITRETDNGRTTLVAEGATADYIQALKGGMR